MGSTLLRPWLMASVGVAALSAGPALAQQDSECAQQLDQRQAELQELDVPEQRRSDVELVIDGGRTLAETGDEQGCDRVLAELDSLMMTLKGAGTQTEQAATGQQTGEGQAEVTAKLTIDQPQPQITVRQAPPQVTVRIPKPIITIRMPPPEVTVQMPDPDVQVVVPDPDIRVTMAQPDVVVQGTDTQASADGGQQVAAKIDYEVAEQQQAQVDVQMEDPEIRVEQAEPTIDIARGAPQQEQPAAGAGQQMAAVSDVASDPSQPGQQVQQALDEAEQALQQEDVETARTALEDAQQGIQGVADQAGDEVQEHLEQAEEAIQQALDALDNDDVAGAQQALVEAKAPIQEAMVQHRSQPESTGQAVTATAGQTQGGAAAGASPLEQMRASELLGAEVVNADGDNVAEIVDMVKRSDSGEVLAVLSVGGFLGLGDKEVAMPMDRFEIGPDEQIILSNATEEELESLPAWDREDASFQGIRQ